MQDQSGEKPLLKLGGFHKGFGKPCHWAAGSLRSYDKPKSESPGPGTDDSLLSFLPRPDGLVPFGEGRLLPLIGGEVVPPVGEVLRQTPHGGQKSTTSPSFPPTTQMAVKSRSPQATARKTAVLSAQFEGP